MRIMGYQQSKKRSFISKGSAPGARFLLFLHQQLPTLLIRRDYKTHLAVGYFLFFIPYSLLLISYRTHAWSPARQFVYWFQWLLPQ